MATKSEKLTIPPTKVAIKANKTTPASVSSEPVAIELVAKAKTLTAKKKASTAPIKKAPLPIKASITNKPVASVSKKQTKSLPTADEIRVQAYYVAEKRMAAGLPGDTDSDWLQAERELIGNL